MKTTVVLGMMSLLLIVAYNNVGGAPRAAAQGPDRPVTLAALADTGSGGSLSERLSEYLFLHQTRDENPSVHAMVGVKACPE
jgi:hypothetical protein